MDSLQYINANNENYMWLFDMEWLTADNILNYQYEEGENRNLVPFAHTGGGDKRAWFIVDEKEYPVVLCYHDDCEGELCAKNIRDTLFRHIIEFVSGNNFYFEKEKLSVLANLKSKELFVCNTKFGQWCVLLSIDEASKIINKYARFESCGQSI